MSVESILPDGAYRVDEDSDVKCSLPKHMREGREAAWRVDYLAGGQTFVAVCGEECARVAADELAGHEVLEPADSPQSGSDSS